MDGWPKATAKLSNRMGKLNTQLNCLQINLQHSRSATENLLKIIEEEVSDILCIQETYTIGNKIVGLPRTYTAFASGEGRKQAAIVINSEQIDTILMTQHSDEDAVVLEARVDNLTFLIASVYVDITRPLVIDLQKMQEILTHAEGVGINFSMDNNARSTSWHDVKKREDTTAIYTKQVAAHSFSHSVFCLTTGPRPPLKRFLHIVRSRASSFK
jgi:hypothetical protein